MYNVFGDHEVHLILNQLEEQIGLPKNFILNLMENDDWSMIIKMHALIEATLNKLLAIRLNQPSIENIISRLDLSDAQRGKIKIAKNLSLIDQDEIQFIRWLSEMRNKIVHDISNVTFDLHSFFESCTKQQKDAVISKMLYLFDNENDPRSRREEIGKSFKLVVWSSSAAFCAMTALKIQTIGSKNKYAELQSKLAEAFITIQKHSRLAD